MADFYVPLATNTLSSIDSLIANAPGATKIGEAIGNLPDAYWAGQNQRNIQEQRDVFKNGLPANPGELLTALAKVQGAGAAPAIMQYYKMLYGQQADQAVTPSDTSGATLPTTRLAPPSSAGGAVSENVPVPSSPTVVGDAEGVNRGLYESPTAPGARPPIQGAPSQLAAFAQRFPATQQLSGGVQTIPGQGFNTAGEIAAPANADPTLGGLVPRGRTPQQQITLLSRAISSDLLSPEQAKSYQGRIDAINQALNVYREGAVRNAELPQDVKTARAAGYGNPLDYEQAKARTTANVAQETKQYEEATKDYKVAQVGQYRLGLINNSINSLGPQWMGSGANFRANAAKTYNSYRDLLPEAARNAVPQFDPNKIASWEDFNKQTMNLGFELARTLGSREAQQIVKQATSSVPGALQTFWGARLVSASMNQAFQRSADYREFLDTVPPGQRLRADILFNKAHPVDEYVAKAASVVPPQKAIDAVRQNPALRSQFDAKYGNGASIGVFGTQ